MGSIYKKIGIYEIKNKLNKNVYIGKTAMNFGDRWDSHRALLRSNKHFNKHLQNAWNKYGEENFEFNIVKECSLDDDLDLLEKDYIKKFKEENLSYNMTDGGDGGCWLGKHLTDEAKRKIGEKNRINMTGRKLSEETRKKMSESQLKRVYTDEEKERRRERLRASNIGKVVSDETKELLRKINQENPPSAKFTPDDIREIRRLKLSGITLNELALKYNTSPSYISNICHFRRWSHVS